MYIAFHEVHLQGIKRGIWWNAAVDTKGHHKNKIKRCNTTVLKTKLNLKIPIEFKSKIGTWF